ncbi:MAG: DNA-binding protein, partial [Chloroflexi bacterium]|nr:DNA-binding protein [Chloroflexota bacterium]
AATTHDSVAGAITTGAADVGPGLRATAAAWDLDFIPLGEERYDLAMPRAAFDSKRLETFLAALHGEAFRREAASFEGYDLTQSGRVVAHIK